MMSNSSLVNYTKISNNSNPRKSRINKITIHHAAGKASVESIGNTLESRDASANYAIGSDGRIGMYVEEANRAWTSGNADNDHQAVTIEVSNDEVGGQWHVSDLVLGKLIELCVDICKRNGIKQLNFTGDKTGNLTMHKWFQATSCPGPYLESKFPYIAEEVNKRLAPAETTKTPEKAVEPKVGDIVSFKGGKHYTSANSSNGYIVKSSKARVTSTSKGSKHPYHLRAVNDNGEYVSGVYGWVDSNTIEGVSESSPKNPSLESIKIGDIVKFVGSTHYPSSSAASGYKTKPGTAKVTNKAKGNHPVHVRAVNSNGSYASGVYGWVDLSDIKL